MVPGGNGTSSTYNPIMPYLSRAFAIAAYGCCQLGSSTVATKKQLNPDQQACDIIAVMRALGRSQTSIFANSSGGLIASNWPSHTLKSSTT
jgi:pimeloyl-ACP methyl ester carboxylesterase